MLAESYTIFTLIMLGSVTVFVLVRSGLAFPLYISA
jgi:hypothetical protein